MSAPSSWPLIEVCHQCGRREGIQEAQAFGDYWVLKCDCNYQHIRPREASSARRSHESPGRAESAIVAYTSTSVAGPVTT